MIFFVFNLFLLGNFNLCDQLLKLHRQDPETYSFLNPMKDKSVPMLVLTAHDRKHTLTSKALMMIESNNFSKDISNHQDQMSATNQSRVRNTCSISDTIRTGFTSTHCDSKFYMDINTSSPHSEYDVSIDDFQSTMPVAVKKKRRKHRRKTDRISLKPRSSVHVVQNCKLPSAGFTISCNKEITTPREVLLTIINDLQVLTDTELKLHRSSSDESKSQTQKSVGPSNECAQGSHCGSLSMVTQAINTALPSNTNKNIFHGVDEDTEEEDLKLSN